MWQDKIDSSFFDVCINNAQEDNCIVFVNDFYQSKDALDSLGIEIVNGYPFINAFCVQAPNISKLIKLANLHIVDYISRVNTASVLMNKTNHIVRVDMLHRLGLYGRGVGVAIIDTGCHPHLDFMLAHSKDIVFVDMINKRNCMYDDNGHGTFVCGVLAGSGYSSGGVYKGVAPECGLVVIKALDKDGHARGIKILDAMQWVLSNKQKYNIKVLCMSFGSEPMSQFDALSIGASSLWDSGITVVSAVGNDGPKIGSIKSPAMARKIISVGCLDAQSSPYKIADFSSRGPIFDITKPDIVSPGVDVVSLSNSLDIFCKMSGTSVSTPVVAGICALLLEYSPKLSPNDLKAVLLNGAIPISNEVNAEGMGLLDALNCLYSIKHD